MTAMDYKAMADEALAQYFVTEQDYPVKGLAEAMRYSLQAGGKRIRPTLVMEFCRVSGGDPKDALPVACAVEMLHTYSLIHDDLPCMDDDELRRGMPTNHMVYGECTATLAGDALQAEAFGTILRSDLPAERRARCAMHLANAVGMDGMCGGQYLDMLGEGKSLSEQELDQANEKGDMHARDSNDMQKARPVHGKIKALILIQIRFIPQHQGLHEGCRIHREKPIHPIRKHSLKADRETAKAGDLTAFGRRVLRVSGEIDPAGKIRIVAFPVTDIGALEFCRTGQNISRNKVFQGISVHVKNQLSFRKLAA